VKTKKKRWKKLHQSKQLQRKLKGKQVNGMEKQRRRRKNQQKKLLLNRLMRKMLKKRRKRKCLKLKKKKKISQNVSQVDKLDQFLSLVK